MQLSRAKLLKRVFEINVAHCPNCGGEFKIIAAILEQPVIKKIRFYRLGRHLSNWRPLPHRKIGPG